MSVTGYNRKWNRTSTKTMPKEEREICNLTTVTSTQPVEPVIPTTQFSNFTPFKRVTTWILRFVKNLHSTISGRSLSPHLTVTELKSAEDYWLMIVQRESFPKECNALEKGQPLPKNSRLLPFRPIWDKDHSVIRVGGRISNSTLSYSQSHPVILNGKHPITKLIILSEHIHLMHAGPTLLLSPLNQRFHIVGARKAVRSVTRQCITCKHHSIKPQDQLLGQLAPERVSQAAPFEKSRVDYTGPFQIKHMRKPTISKTYIMSLCMSHRAVH